LAYDWKPAAEKSASRAVDEAGRRAFSGPSGAPAQTGAHGKIAFAALHHRGFRAYFVTTMLAMMADNIEHVISYWVIFQLFHSPALAGFAVLSHWMPHLLLSVYFGALADRFDSRRIIQTAQFMFMAVSLGWGLLFLTNTMEVWHAVVLLTVHGMAGVLWGPGSQLLIHDIVGPEHLQSAVRLNSTSRQLGVLLGPAVGGGLMLLFGPSVGLLVNAAIYLPLTLWLWRTPHGGRRQTQAAVRRGGLRLKDAIVVFREVAGDRTIASMILLAGLSSLFVGTAFQAQMPEYAHDLGADDAGLAYSALLGANAAGAVVGGILLEGKGLLQPRAQTAVICTILWCLVIAGFAAATSYPLALALLFFAGVLNLTSLSMSQTLVQLRAPTHMRGRLIGLYNMAAHGLKAFSGVTVGLLGSLIGVHWSLALSALVLLTILVLLFSFSARFD
jgi:MFS family permease